MRLYASNSPHAMARFLAMFMVADGKMDTRELDALEKLMVYDWLKLSRKDFTKVLVEYCDDISDDAEQDGTIHLIDKRRIDQLLEEITDPKKRMLTCALTLDVAKADGDMDEGEMTLLHYMMKKWDVSLQDIEEKYARA